MIDRLARNAFLRLTLGRSAILEVRFADVREVYADSDGSGCWVRLRYGCAFHVLDEVNSLVDRLLAGDTPAGLAVYGAGRPH